MIRKFSLLTLVILYLLGAKGQGIPLEISGTFSGQAPDSINLFFENYFSSRDSIAVPIRDGKFHFRLHYTLPALCRIFCGGNSVIEEFYIDQPQTSISLEGKLQEKTGPDGSRIRQSVFRMSSITGSASQQTVRDFKAWQEALWQQNLPDSVKQLRYYEKLKAYILAHPSEKLSAYLLAGRMFILGRAFLYRGDFDLSYSQVKDLSNLLNPELQNTFEGSNLQLLLYQMLVDRHRTTGVRITNFTMADSNQHLIELKSLQPKYVLLELWASWCAPCRAHHPDLKKFYAAHKDQGFEILGISIDGDPKAWKKALRTDQLPWPQVNDPKGESGGIYKYYDFHGIPDNILVGPDGTILGFSLTESDIEAILPKK